MIRKESTQRITLAKMLKVIIVGKTKRRLLTEDCLTMQRTKEKSTLSKETSSQIRETSSQIRETSPHLREIWRQTRVMLRSIR